VRKVLEAAATDLGSKGNNAQYGWGLVNPKKALEAVDARRKSSETQPKRSRFRGRGGAAGVD
jgi:hypothetical protein